MSIPKARLSVSEPRPLSPPLFIESSPYFTISAPKLLLGHTNLRYQTDDFLHFEVDFHSIEHTSCHHKAHHPLPDALRLNLINNDTHTQDPGDLRPLHANHPLRIRTNICPPQPRLFWYTPLPSPKSPLRSPEPSHRPTRHIHQLRHLPPPRQVPFSHLTPARRAPFRNSFRAERNYGRQHCSSEHYV